MDSLRGRNRNTATEASVTTVEVNENTASVVAVANPARIHITINLDGGTAEEEVFVRFYPAGDDDLKKGLVIKRKIIGATSINDPRVSMDGDNVYTGEISAISESGTFDVHVTEF